MDMDLKRTLRNQLDAIAPEYGLTELSFPSFVRCYGYHMPPLSAIDAVEALQALLDAATGVHIEVEVDGARHGGEWFGGGRVWQAPGKWSTDDGSHRKVDAGGELEEPRTDGQGEADDNKNREPWLVRNFWNAFDALYEWVPINARLIVSYTP